LFITKIRYLQTKKLYNIGLVAALLPDMFCNFYLVKNHKIANNLATTEAREKYNHIFGILRILEKN
jgi:hypothetical protein